MSNDFYNNNNILEKISNPDKYNESIKTDIEVLLAIEDESGDKFVYAPSYFSGDKYLLENRAEEIWYQCGEKAGYMTDNIFKKAAELYLKNHSLKIDELSNESLVWRKHKRKICDILNKNGGQY